MVTVSEAKKRVERRDVPVPLETALVAHRYYLENLSKSDIAHQLGISRFKVARLLDEAKAAGIVRIEVELPEELDLELGAHIQKQCGARLVLVLKDGDGSVDTVARGMAHVGAEYLMNAVGASDVLGLSWGATVARVIDKVDSLPAVDCVQMVGGVRSSGLDTNGSELVRRLSQVAQSEAYPLMAPLIVESELTATALRNDAAIADVMGRYSQITFALVGIGSWDPMQSSLVGEMSGEDSREARESGAVADVCGIILSHDGTPTPTGVQHRTLSIGFDELRAVQTVLAVAGGADKAQAVSAALRSGLVDVLVTDSRCATAMVANHF
jgi:DNA-binding transcriptional regulator LsrR (DeoR family)